MTVHEHRYEIALALSCAAGQALILAACLALLAGCNRSPACSSERSTSAASRHLDVSAMPRPGQVEASRPG